jgi:hypothetical protein
MEPTTPAQKHLGLTLPSATTAPDIPVHRFAVRPTYGDGWPLTITLAQYSSAGHPTRAIAVRVERDALRHLVGTFKESFRKTLMRNAAGRDPALLELGDDDFEELGRLPPDSWVHATLGAARTAASFNGAEVAWYEVSTIDVALHLGTKPSDGVPDDESGLVATPALRTPMPPACLLGLVNALTAEHDRPSDSD